MILVITYHMTFHSVIIALAGSGTPPNTFPSWLHCLEGSSHATHLLCWGTIPQVCISQILPNEVFMELNVNTFYEYNNLIDGGHM